jgi:hypothetical protein
MEDNISTIQEEKIERLIEETQKEEPLLNFSELLEEKISYQVTPESEYEWLVTVKPKRIAKLEKELQNKKQRLTHCENFVMKDKLCEEDGKVYIKSEGKPNWYLDMEKDSMDIKLLFCEFYQCEKDKEKLPEEIELLKDMLHLLKN